MLEPQEGNTGFIVSWLNLPSYVYCLRLWSSWIWCGGRSVQPAAHPSFSSSGSRWSATARRLPRLQPDASISSWTAWGSCWSTSCWQHRSTRLLSIWLVLSYFNRKYVCKAVLNGYTKPPCYLNRVERNSILCKIPRKVAGLFVEINWKESGIVGRILIK